MGMLPALATAVMLGIGVNQDHGWIDNGLQYALTASGLCSKCFGVSKECGATMDTQEKDLTQSIPNQLGCMRD